VASVRADELLSEVDSLPYHRRMATLARHARTLADDRTGVPPLLAELLAGEAFQREVALFMASVIRRDDLVTAALTDPD